MCSENDVNRNKNIYEQYKAGAACEELSRMYGVSSARIREIVKNEKKKEEYDSDEIYQLLLTLTDDRKNATRAYTLLKKSQVHTKEDLLEFDEQRLKKLRNCGAITKDLIVKLKETIENGTGERVY